MKTVKIGSQTWSAENLYVDHYRNGDIIPEVQDPEEWANLTTGAWCYYENDSENGKKYGKLYNWYAVNDPRGLAPEGWHIPTKGEFETLLSTVNNDGKFLMADGKDVGTNKSGFSAKLSGYRYYNGNFNYLGINANCWSSTACSETGAYYLRLYYNDSGADIVNGVKELGLSIRVINDTKDIKDMNDKQLLNNLYIDGIIRNTIAIHICPENPTFYALRGQLRASIDDPKGFMEDIEKAVELIPNSPKTKKYDEIIEKILKDFRG